MRERGRAVDEFEFGPGRHDPGDDRGVLRTRLRRCRCGGRLIQREQAADLGDDRIRLGAVVDEDQRMIVSVGVAGDTRPPDPQRAAVDIEPGRKPVGQFPRRVAGADDVDAGGAADRLVEVGRRDERFAEPLGNRDAHDRRGPVRVENAIGEKPGLVRIIDEVCHRDMVVARLGRPRVRVGGERRSGERLICLRTGRRRKLMHVPQK